MTRFCLTPLYLLVILIKFFGKFGKNLLLNQTNYNKISNFNIASTTFPFLTKVPEVL